MVRLISDFNGLYGQDSHEYLRFSRRLAEFFLSGRPPGDYFWPVNFPLSGALFSFVVPGDIFARQLISIVSFVCLQVYIFKLIHMLYSPEQKGTVYLYICLFSILSPFFFQAAFLIMSDMLATCFMTAAAYHILAYRQRLNSTDFLIAVFCTASAIMTRYPTTVILWLPGFLLAKAFLSNFRLRNFLLALAIFIVCLLPHFLVRGSGSAEFLGHSFLQNWSVSHWFLSEFVNVDGYHQYFFPNLIYSLSNFFYPGYFFIGIALVFFLRKSDVVQLENQVILASVFIYVIFLAGLPYQNMRYLLIPFPLVVVAMFPAFQRFSEKLLKVRSRKILFFVTVILLQVFLIRKYSTAIYEANQLEKQIHQVIKTQPERPLYSFAMDVALLSYSIENKIVNLWSERIHSVEMDALILFNEQQFARQMAEKNPMLNWRFIQENYELEILQKFSNGWILYSVGN